MHKGGGFVLVHGDGRHWSFGSLGRRRKGGMAYWLEKLVQHYILCPPLDGWRRRMGSGLCGGRGCGGGISFRFTPTAHRLTPANNDEQLKKG